MVIDSSALVALLLGEPETARFVTAIAGASSRSVSAPSYVETAIVMVTRSGQEAQQKLDQLLSDLGIEVIPFTRDQAQLAVAAFRQFGRGTGHPAALNYGDCFSYALAKFRGEAILFKGNDFSQTDLEISAIPSDPS
jgi:ribonuclease VapC